MSSRLAILIGFGYFKRSEGKLLSVYIDLYHVYRYCLSINIPSDSIHVITDIVEETSCRHIISAIADDIVDVDISSFIETLQKNKTYHLYRPLHLLEDIKTILSRSTDYLFLYFTGHGCESLQTRSSSFLQMPDGTCTEISTLHQVIFSIPHLIVIYDCCHLSIIDLPYRYQVNRFHLMNVKRTPRNEIIVIAASHRDREARSSRLGSLFTRDLFKQLLSEKRTWHQILRGYSSTDNPYIYSSYPSLKYVPSWLLGSTWVEVRYDYERSGFLIQRHPFSPFDESSSDTVGSNGGSAE